LSQSERRKILTYVYEFCEEKAIGAPLKLPPRDASDDELSDFFDRHEGFDLLDRGILEIGSDYEELERMLTEYSNRADRQAHDRAPGETQDA
jgi:hypothetical protein